MPRDTYGKGADLIRGKGAGRRLTAGGQGRLEDIHIRSRPDASSDNQEAAVTGISLLRVSVFPNFAGWSLPTQ